MPEQGKKYIRKADSFYAPAPSLATLFTLHSAGIWRVTVCPVLDDSHGECRFIWPFSVPQETSKLVAKGCVLQGFSGNAIRQGT